MVRPRSRALAVYVGALACLTGACSSGTDARASAPTTTKPAAPPTAHPTTRWLAFAGGFTVSRPACVPLLVKAGTKQQLVHIAVGAACALRERGSR